MMFQISMHLLSIALTFVVIVTSVEAYWKGFNIKDNLSDGTTCRGYNDWKDAFNTMKNLPGTTYGSFNSARLYSSYECQTLANAVPAALATNTKLLVGIDPELNYEAEKGALLAAVRKHGFDWVVAVSVGSEDVYRGQTNASALVEKIYDVRGMLANVAGYSTSIKVGHVDTNNVWFNTDNRALIRACDFIGADVYPYFQTNDNNSIENSLTLFNNGVSKLRSSVTAAGSSASVWITETGWPNNGTTKNNAVASVANAKQYYKTVGCSAFKSLNTFWFTLQDWSAYPSFGVIDENGTPFFDFSC